MDKKTAIEELLEVISNDNKYSGYVFKVRSIYFIIVNGELLEIRDTIANGPHWSSPLKLVRGPKKEENEYISAMMDDFDFDEYFFSDIIWSYNEEEFISDEDVIEFFEDNEDEESLEIYKKMRERMKNDNFPFENLTSFIFAVNRWGLDSDTVYYEFEDEFIDLYNNICEIGQSMGEYDSFCEDEWIDILENINEYIVRV